MENHDNQSASNGRRAPARKRTRENGAGQSVAELNAKIRVLEQRVAAAERREQEQAKERAYLDDLKAKVDLILEVMDDAAQGDLTRQIPFSGDDAAGKLAGRLNTFLGTMRRSVGNIADNATTLGAAAEELSSVAKQMTSNATQIST